METGAGLVRAPIETIAAAAGAQCSKVSLHVGHGDDGRDAPRRGHVHPTDRACVVKEGGAAIS